MSQAGLRLTAEMIRTAAESIGVLYAPYGPRRLAAVTITDDAQLVSLGAVLGQAVIAINDGPASAEAMNAVRGLVTPVADTAGAVGTGPARTASGERTYYWPDVPDPE